MNAFRIVVPGRVNLIGEHIDYHNLPVLPMAIPRHIVMDVSSTADGVICLQNATYGTREFALDGKSIPIEFGDWGNYVKAAIQSVGQRWNFSRGFQGQIHSTLPAAAGLSSSSALLIAVTVALLRVNGIEPKLEELMAILPEGEHFVGTRGGGMDHAAILASRANCASLIAFRPFEMQFIPIPAGWCFLVANSLVRAEKAGGAKAGYNACRAAGQRALEKYGAADFSAAMVAANCGLLDARVPLSREEESAFAHVCQEAERVQAAVVAMSIADRKEFGRLLNASHESLRDLLQVSCAALDRIVEIANAAGADGARLTGAGFGGSAVILCGPERQAGIITALERDFYSEHGEYDPGQHLFSVRASGGAFMA